MTPADVLKLINEKEAKFADLRFTDTLGKEQHVTIPTRLVDVGFFTDGDRKSTRLNSSHYSRSRMPSSA